MTQKKDIGDYIDNAAIATFLMIIAIFLAILVATR
jgi:hypothetical protein